MTDISKAFGLEKLYKPVSFSLSPSEKSTDDQTPSFAEIFKSTLGEVNSLQYQAKQAQIALATGVDDVSLHQVMVITEQARLALDFMMAVRNKIMDAYNEVMRMQI